MTVTGGDLMMTKSTKAGLESSSHLSMKRREHEMWRACFAAAIAGTLSAHRGMPNPDVVIRLAATMADRALDECVKRYKTLLLLVCALSLSACGGSATKPSQSVKVEYFVTGSASRASMTYATAGGGTAQQADRALPWSFNTTMATGDYLYISAQNSGSTGCVSVEIRTRGSYYKSTQSCGAFVIATASGTVE